MTTSPVLKYGSKGWKDNSHSVPDIEIKDNKNRDKNWQQYSSVLEADPAEMLKRKLPEN